MFFNYFAKVPLLRMASIGAFVGLVLIVAPVAKAEEASSTVVVNPDVFASACETGTLQSIASSISQGITVKKIPNLVGQDLPGGAKYVPATASLPAYCQVSGSFLTNPETGKTANFLATFPENWNGKYLQYGCFGSCGFIVLNDAASPLVTIIAQGLPGDSLRKGYASFGTDEGHMSQEAASWAVKGPGVVDDEALEDFYIRSTRVLATAAKKFTVAYYSTLSKTKQTITRSYFNGCSGGGRDAMLAASNYPEEFDGIIAGSPASDITGASFQGAAVALAQGRSVNARLTPALTSLLDQVVKATCDSADGVKDGLIQNPAACDFLPERDLPKCEVGSAQQSCFTPEQIDTVNVHLTAVTDEHGNVVQPGFSASEIQIGGTTYLADSALPVMLFRNPADFSLESKVSFTDQSVGPVSGYRAVVKASDVAVARNNMHMGVVTAPEEMDKLIKQDHKLLIWHNLSDQLLTPYVSVNYYKQLAERHGGYENLQENIRLFTIPDTLHCSGGVGGVGPNSFDALSAMENWVEKGQVPNAQIATYYPGDQMGGKDFSQPPGRTMPLCAFPQMAHYTGEGDINDAANWSCPQGDQSMLKVGESGLRAGVSP